METEKIEKEKKRESNDRLMAIACARQQLLFVPASEGEIRRVGRSKARERDRVVENSLD